MSAYDDLIKKLQASDQAMAKPEQKPVDSKITYVDIRQPGVYQVRLLPNLAKPDDVPFERVFLHLGFTHPNYKKVVPLVCKGKECPLCATYRKRVSGGSQDAWRYKSNQRFIYYVVIEKEGREQIALLTVNYYVHEEIKNYMIKELKQGTQIFSLKEGKWIEIEYKKIADKNKYMVRGASDTQAVSSQIRAQLERLKPLNKFYSYADYTPEQLKKIIQGEPLMLENNKNSLDNRRSTSTFNREPVVNKDLGIHYDSDEIELPGTPSKPSRTSILDSDEEDGMPDNMRRLDEILNQNNDEE